MKKTIRLTESDLVKLVKKVIKEQVTAVMAAAKDAIGAEKFRPDQLNDTIMGWLQQNRINKGDFVTSLKDKNKITLRYFPNGLLGTSKAQNIVTIPRPKGLQKNSGNWTFDGLRINYDGGVTTTGSKYNEVFSDENARKLGVGANQIQDLKSYM